MSTFERAHQALEDLAARLEREPDRELEAVRAAFQALLVKAHAREEAARTLEAQRDQALAELRKPGTAPTRMARALKVFGWVFFDGKGRARFRVSQRTGRNRPDVVLAYVLEMQGALAEGRGPCSPNEAAERLIEHHRDFGFDTRDAVRAWLRSKREQIRADEDAPERAYLGDAALDLPLPDGRDL